MLGVGANQLTAIQRLRAVIGAAIIMDARLLPSQERGHADALRVEHAGFRTAFSAELLAVQQARDACRVRGILVVNQVGNALAMPFIKPAPDVNAAGSCREIQKRSLHRFGGGVHRDIPEPLPQFFKQRIARSQSSHYQRLPRKSLAKPTTAIAPTIAQKAAQRMSVAVSSH